MKRFMVVSASLLLCAGVYGQGSPGNVAYLNTTSTKVQVFQGGSLVPAPTGGGYEVELFYQPNNGGPTPAAIDGSFSLGSWQGTTVLTVAATGLPPGIFDGGVTSLPGVAGGANAWFQVVGWNNAQTTLAGAETSSTLFAFSPLFSITTGDPNAQPPTIPPLTSGPDKFTGIIIGFPGMVFAVPEPSTYALGGLSVAALLFFRPRKSVV
jgi:hypothetical protein